MNTENIKNKLVALEANVDAVLFRLYEDEEKGGSRLAGAALGGGAVAGGFLADKAIMRKYGGSRRDAYGAFGSDAKKVGQAGYGAGMKGWQRSGAQGAGIFSRLKRTLGGATRAMTGGRYGFSEIEGRVNRLIELADRNEKSYVGGAAGGAVKGAAATGALGALGGGALAALGIKAGAFRRPISQKALRSMRRSGVDKEAIRRSIAPALIASASAHYGAKAAKYGALVGGGIGIGSAHKKELSEIEGRVNRLIELAEVRINEKGQRSDQNLRRGAVGFLTGSVTSGVGTMVNADRFSQENEVYRKRDAAGHALVGGLAGVPVAAAGNIAALRMRSPGAMAATAIGGTLGALGVGYGVSRAMADRSLDKRKRNAMLARLQSGQQG